MGIGFAEGDLTTRIYEINQFSVPFFKDILVCVALGVDMVIFHKLSNFAGV